MSETGVNSESVDMTDQAASLRKLAAPCRAVGVISGQIGLGHTTILASLATELAQQTDWKILIFSQRKHHPHDNRSALLQILGGKLDAGTTLADLPFEAKLLPSRYDNLDLFYLSENAAFLASEAVDQIHKLEAQLKEITRNYEFILLDFGQVIEDVIATPAALPEEIITFTTPTKDSRTQCYTLVKDLLKNEPNAQINLIVNMASSSAVADNVAQSVQSVVKRFLDHELQTLGKILIDPDMISATRHGLPVTDMLPEAPISESIQKIAAQLCENHDQHKITLVKLGTLLVQNFVTSSKNRTSKLG